MSDKEMTAPSGQEEVKEELTVEESFAALEKITARLESEDVTLEESFHLAHVCTEEGVSQPCDSIDGNNCDHTRLPDISCNGILWLGTTDYYH